MFFYLYSGIHTHLKKLLNVIFYDSIIEDRNMLIDVDIHFLSLYYIIIYYISLYYI